MLDNTLNHPSKFRTKNWVETNNDSHVTYDFNNQIRFKTSMLKSSLCDYIDAYILVSATITITCRPDDADDATDANERTDERNKEVIFKNCAPFIECTSEINKKQMTA